MVGSRNVKKLSIYEDLWRSMKIYEVYCIVYNAYHTILYKSILWAMHDHATNRLGIVTFPQADRSQRQCKPGGRKPRRMTLRAGDYVNVLSSYPLKSYDPAHVISNCCVWICQPEPVNHSQTLEEQVKAAWNTKHRVHHNPHPNELSV